ncbi:MAG: biotin attachment protein [Candidatus Wallbacteria bacterium]|nr:biotin attachment protein [Candidatus Wallbacteria bacterium]
MNLTFELDGETVSIDLEPAADGGYRARLEGRELAVHVHHITPVYAVFTAAGRTYRAQLAAARNAHHVAIDGEFYDFQVVTQRSRERSGGGRGAQSGGARITSPMPGKVIRVLVEDGQEVAAGQGLLILEAMKMENEIRTPVAGKVKRVHVTAAQMVMPADLLVEVE